jgi:hypothetical protein
MVSTHGPHRGAFVLGHVIVQPGECVEAAAGQSISGASLSSCWSMGCLLRVLLDLVQDVGIAFDGEIKRQSRVTRACQRSRDSSYFLACTNE